MQYRKLGNTDLDVSLIALGTMTFGEQNTEDEAHDQLDYALERGINLIDTAEMYPVPPRAETQGRTEHYIGNWLQKTGHRDRVLLATKVSGRSTEIDYLRTPPLRLNRSHIEAAINDSLKRLQTDYIDLYQLHWPDRHTNFFGRRGYVHHPDEDPEPIEETLSVLGDLVKAGKVRYVGVSNETPWGVMRYLRAAEQSDLPRIVSIQNPYSLLNRTFEVGLAECAHREQVGLLAYSPLAFGMLTGKYHQGRKPAGARLTLFERFTRYSNEQARAATDAYVALAKRYGLDPAQMALAYVNSRPFLTANIIGASSLEQLETNIDSLALSLPQEILDEIEAIHARYPNPAP